MAQVGRGVSLHLHVSILLSTRVFFNANLSFSYAVPLFFLCSMAQVGRGVSLHLHVSILLSTRVFFMLICPFLMLSLSFSDAPRRTWDRHPCTRPDLFWCYPLCGAGFFLCCVCPFLMLHGALSIHLHVSPSISMSPSCCRHACFLMPTGLSLMRAVSPFMPSVFFESVLFLSCPLFFLCSMARVGRGGGAPFYKTRPFLVLSFMRSWLFFLLRLSFSYAPWGAFHPSPCLSLHLHVSHPVVDMFVFGLRTLPFCMLLLSFLCSMGQRMVKGRAWGSLAGPGLVSWPLREPDPFL